MLLGHQVVLSRLTAQLKTDSAVKCMLLRGLAILSAEQEKYAQAESLFGQELRIWQQVWGPEHHQVAVALMNLGEAMAFQGKDEQAESLLQQAQQIEERIWGSAHPQVAYPLNDLAHLYAKQGKHEQAEPLFWRALQMWEQGLGSEHPEVATALAGLGRLWLSQGKDEQAEEVLQRALSIREQQLGQDHPETAQTLHDLALLRQQQGRLDEARSLAERACSIRSQSLGDAHPKTIASRTLLAQLEEAQGTGQDRASCPPHTAERPKKEGAFIPQEAGDRIPAENDLFQVFLDACCHLHPLAWCTIRELWDTYEHWMVSCQERIPLSRRAFAAQLKARGCQVDRTNKARIWRGIQLMKTPSVISVTKVTKQ